MQQKITSRAVIPAEIYLVSNLYFFITSPLHIHILHDCRICVNKERVFITLNLQRNIKAAGMILPLMNLCLEILGDVLGQAGNICAGADGELYILLLAEIIQPCQKLLNSLVGRIVQHLEEVIYKYMGDVIVTGMDTADKALELCIAADAVIAAMDKAYGVGNIINQLFILVNENDVSIFGLDSGLEKIHHLLGLTGTLETHNEFNQINHAPSNV